MFVVLLVALLCVPLLELYVIIRVAGGVGTPETIGLLIAVSVVGALMVRRSGIGVLNQIRARLDRGEVPTGELVDGLLILVAGALMLTPGFITDAVGLLLLFFPTRLAVRSLLVRRFAKKVDLHGWAAGPGGRGGFGFGHAPGGRGGFGFGHGSGGRGGFGHAPGGGRRRPGGGDVRDVDYVREVGDRDHTKRDQDGD